MLSSISRRLARRLGLAAKLLPVAALALGFGALSPPQVLAHQGHAGGGHPAGGGFHGGGGWHGGPGWHGGWNGGWGWRGGWGWGWRGGWGWWHPGWGWGWGWWNPWWGWGWGWNIGVYDPFWYGYDAPSYSAPPAYSAPDYYGQPPGGGPAGAERSGGIYTWNLGIQGGRCDRAYIAGGPSPASLGSGARIGGIVVSSVIGGRIGPRLDLSDQACATAALELAQPNATVSWTTASGIPLTIQTTRDYQQSDGSACRDFVATARFASQVQTVHGSACRNHDTGGWEPIG